MHNSFYTTVLNFAHHAYSASFICLLRNVLCFGRNLTKKTTCSAFQDRFYSVRQLVNQNFPNNYEDVYAKAMHYIPNRRTSSKIRGYIKTSVKRSDN